MVKLFSPKNYSIDTSIFTHLLHGRHVNELEESIASYVGARYGVCLSSATAGIFLHFIGNNARIEIPSMLPPVVANALISGGNSVFFKDDPGWVGHSYILHQFSDYKFIDSAQNIYKNQFAKECNDNDCMLFSFYPTKPLSGLDGGIVVSNDRAKIERIRTLAHNGCSLGQDSSKRKPLSIGFKMYLSSFQAEFIRRNFTIYEEKLKRIRIVREYYNAKFNLNCTSNHLYRLQVKQRSLLQNKFREAKVQFGIHYKPLTSFPLYKFCDREKMNLTNFAAKHTISIPFHDELTEQDLDLVVNIAKPHVF